MKASLYPVSFSKHKSNHSHTNSHTHTHTLSLTHTHTLTYTYTCLKAFNGSPYVLWSWYKYLTWPKRPFGVYPQPISPAPACASSPLGFSFLTFISKKLPTPSLPKVSAQTLSSGWKTSFAPTLCYLTSGKFFLFIQNTVLALQPQRILLWSSSGVNQRSSV